MSHFEFQNMINISMTSGIYSITHTESCKRYIGSSIDIKRRWNAHRSALNRGISNNPHLQNAWTKYGKDSFVFEIIEDQIDPQLLESKENEYIIKFGIGSPESSVFDQEKGYNTTRAGRTGCVDSSKCKRGAGHHLYGKPSPNKGKKYSDEVRKNMSVGQLGKKANHTQPHSEEAKKKNKPWSEARRAAQEKRKQGV